MWSTFLSVNTSRSRHCSPASGKARAKAFVELRRLLAVHETAEERLHDERQATAVLQRLEKLDVDSEEFTRELSKLRDAVIDHAEREEQDEFAGLGEELSGDELERMGRAAKLAEAVAPTRPHAGVESQVTNLAAGPFAAMLDRARDGALRPLCDSEDRLPDP
jgi:hypothetical protein